MRIFGATVNEPRENISVVHQSKGLFGGKVAWGTASFFVNDVMNLRQPATNKKVFKYPMRISSEVNELEFDCESFFQTDFLTTLEP